MAERRCYRASVCARVLMKGTLFDEHFEKLEEIQRDSTSLTSSEAELMT